MVQNEQNKKEGFILIVDDIPKNLQLLGKTLRDEGYKIAAVSKPELVLESARKYDPDLILLDVMMPGISGFEVCRQIKADTALKHIPVIFLTAKVEQESVVEGFNLGGADYVTKPFNKQELLARVDTHISLKLSKDQLKEQNEKLVELNVMKDRIYSVIGHDLRGSVNGINGVTNLLLDELDHEVDLDKLKKFLTLISQSSSNLWNLLTDLLSWARVQNKELKVNKSEFNLLKALEPDVKLAQHDAESKGITIHLNVEDDLQINADISVLKTIVRNFLSNAVKFSEKNDRIDLCAEMKDSLEISVRDSGIGMLPETKESLFKMNHPKNESEMNTHGAGFGLLLCHKLAELHGGKITVESREGEGSVFTLIIPQKGKAVIAA